MASLVLIKKTQVVFNHMNFALKLAKSSGSQFVNAAVIVDPSLNQIITSSCDEISSWNVPFDDYEAHLQDADEYSTFHDAANGSSSIKFSLSGSPYDPKTSCRRVSCLNPWKWSQPHLSSLRSCFWHPLRHAAMVAIEYSATRDRRLHPDVGEADGICIESDPNVTLTKELSAKQQKTTLANMNSGDSKFEGPYLCTGYDIYLAWEPCAI